MYLECLKYLVGLASSDCNCYSTGRPVDFDTSYSGKFITDYVSLKFAGSAADCEQGGVWDILETSRRQAITDFIADFMAELLARKKQRFQAFANQEIGQFRYTANSAFSPSATVAGVEFQPLQIRGGKQTLYGVSLALAGFVGSIDVDVNVYSSADLTTSLGSVTITLTAPNTRVYQAFATPIVLDLGGTDTELKYYFVYDVPAGTTFPNSPIDELVTGSTGCCGSVAQSVQAADYRFNPFKQFGKWSGVEANGATNLMDAPLILNGETKGLRLRTSLGCDSTEMLCNWASFMNQDAPQNMGETYNLALNTSLLIAFKAAYHAANKVVDSANINRITTMSKEALWGKMQNLNKRYHEGIVWLAQNTPDSENDCWTCKDDSSLLVKSILI